MSENKNPKNINEQDIFEDATTECMVDLKGAELQTYYLYEAIANNDLEAASQAIINGANVNASSEPCSEDDDTPLDSAALWSSSYDCSIEMIKLLRQYGATNYDLEKVKYYDKSDRCQIADYIQRKP